MAAVRSGGQGATASRATSMPFRCSATTGLMRPGKQRGDAQQVTPLGRMARCRGGSRPSRCGARSRRCPPRARRALALARVSRHRPHAAVGHHGVGAEDDRSSSQRSTPGTATLIQCPEHQAAGELLGHPVEREAEKTLRVPQRLDEANGQQSIGGPWTTGLPSVMATASAVGLRLQRQQAGFDSRQSFVPARGYEASRRGGSTCAAGRGLREEPFSASGLGQVRSVAGRRRCSACRRNAGRRTPSVFSLAPQQASQRADAVVLGMAASGSASRRL